MVDGDVAPPGVLRRLVPLVDYAVFSDTGLLIYAECDDVDAALLKVGKEHSGHVGATCGSQGYAWYDNGDIRRVTAPAVKVVDTLGAGDVFHGTFTWRCLRARIFKAQQASPVSLHLLKCLDSAGASAARHATKYSGLLTRRVKGSVRH